MDSDEKKPPMGGVEGVPAAAVSWLEVETRHHALPQPPTLHEQVGAAIWLICSGLDRPAINAHSSAIVMHPQTHYTRTGVIKAVARLLTDSLTVALRAAPPEEIERIQTALAECHQRWAPQP